LHGASWLKILGQIAKESLLTHPQVLERHDLLYLSFLSMILEPQWFLAFLLPPIKRIPQKIHLKTAFHAESIFKIKNINKSNNYKNLILDIKRFFIGFSQEYGLPIKLTLFALIVPRGRCGTYFTE
jgi:hypothetical protein